MSEFQLVPEGRPPRIFFMFKAPGDDDGEGNLRSVVLAKNSVGDDVGVIVRFRSYDAAFETFDQLRDELVAERDKEADREAA